MTDQQPPQGRQPTEEELRAYQEQLEAQLRTLRFGQTHRATSGMPEIERLGH